MSENTEKKNKKKGPIRFEAIIPVLVLSTITFVYFSYYFDHHLKKLVEYVGTQANGAEVNVDSIRTSFIRGSFELNRLQVTNKEKPIQNILEIERMHFKYLWDALLRMKFVVEDASIENIQIYKPRKSPGDVLPPEPAKPSKLTQIQNEVIAQVKNKYSSNMLGDIISILEGGDYMSQVDQIRGSLKSEARVKEMLADLQSKKQSWTDKANKLSDTTKLKAVEAEVQSITSQKNILEQAKGIKRLTDLLKEVNDQYKEVQKASDDLKSEISTVTKYPQELQTLVTQDIAELKNHFAIPKLDFKDMAMHLFAGQFVQYIAEARKYQAMAKQYMPEKKNDEEPVIPHKRAQGENYHFPITTGYPLFWLKRAAISSKGTAESYSGNVSGELTNVTNAPAQIQRPLKLDLKGDFPTVQVNGVQAVFTLDHTQAISRIEALLKVASFAVPEKMFTETDKLKFGFLKATGSTTFNASLVEDQVNINWASSFNQPQFIVETPNKIAKEILTNTVNAIPVINLNGSATGTFTDLNLHISSNLADELSSGLQREIGNKITEAQNKITAMIDERINKPKADLMAQLGSTNQDLTKIENIKKLYKKNEANIKAEIERFKKNGGIDGLKEKGKNLLKGIKF
ncbi:MAG: TIGR03545 family protein [Bacteriovoracaceae bacterium]